MNIYRSSHPWCELRQCIGNFLGDDLTLARCLSCTALANELFSDYVQEILDDYRLWLDCEADRHCEQCERIALLGDLERWFG